MLNEFKEVQALMSEAAAENNINPLARSIGIILVSLAVLATGVYLVISQETPATAQIGAGLLGSVVTYWLK